METVSEAWLLATFLSIFYTFMMFSFVFWIIQALANMTLYKRAGYPAWSALIPLYNLYVQQMITFSKEKGIFILCLLIPVAGPIYAAYLNYQYARAFGLSEFQSILYIFFAPFFNIYLALSNNHDYLGSRKFFLD